MISFYPEGVKRQVQPICSCVVLFKGFSCLTKRVNADPVNKHWMDLSLAIMLSFIQITFRIKRCDEN